MNINFSAGNNLNNIVKGSQTISETQQNTTTINVGELKKQIEDELTNAGVSKQIQEEVIDELQDAVEKKEPSKIKAVLDYIKDKAPEVATNVLTNAMTVIMAKFGM